jgi:uncharacterized protein YjbJ (UPF0337 family)
MNKDIFKGKWKQLQGSIRKKWADITDDEIGEIQGDGEKFIGVLQEKYGWGRERAEQEFNDFLAGSNSTDAWDSDRRRNVS